jgi:hypothetical protein
MNAAIFPQSPGDYLIKAFWKLHLRAITQAMSSFLKRKSSMNTQCIDLISADRWRLGTRQA